MFNTVAKAILKRLCSNEMEDKLAWPIFMFRIINFEIMV
jgi:hypothetical protein